MTFTVKDKNSVTADGQWPYSMEATYSCSYQKGTVRKDDVATLTVSGLGGLTVETVDVYVKSNKTSGAGTFTVSVNDQTVATKTGTFKDWTGAYDKDTYHAIRVLNKACSDVETISVKLTGLINSLYIEKYVISYATKPARTVTLMYGEDVYATLQEETGGDGVLIPMGPDVEGWWCIGWSKTGCEKPIDVSKLVQPNNKFYPSEDCTLWAIYQYTAEDEMVYENGLRSGDYLYVNTYLMIALTGVPSEGRMSYAPVDKNDPSQVYSFSFQGTDTAYITHTQTGTPIGYEGTKMAAKKSPWLVFHNGNETLFYTIIKGKKYVLWHHIEDIVKNEYYAGLIQVNTIEGGPVSLSPLGEVKEPIFSCYPELEMGLITVTGYGLQVTGKWIFPFGAYDLIIENGKKRLVIRD
jgi:hypothetical protein